MRETATQWHDGQIALVRHAPFASSPPPVIPGQPEGLSPESISPQSKWLNGFQAHRSAMPRNDEAGTEARTTAKTASRTIAAIAFTLMAGLTGG